MCLHTVCVRVCCLHACVVAAVLLQAKRAARDAERGFDVAAVRASVHDFVAAGGPGDMMALPPAGKHGSAFTQALAGLYGLKATLQGSGKKRFVMVQGTARSVLPHGKDASKVSPRAGRQAHGNMAASHRMVAFRGALCLHAPACVPLAQCIGSTARSQRGCQQCTVTIRS